MNAQSRVLEEHLRAARVPAKVVGAQSFFERKEVNATALPNTPFQC